MSDEPKIDPIFGLECSTNQQCTDDDEWTRLMWARVKRLVDAGDWAFAMANSYALWGYFTALYGNRHIDEPTYHALCMRLEAINEQCRERL